MGLTRSNYHKRRATGGRRIPLRIKRKHALARPPAATKLSANEKRVHKVRTRGGHTKFRALRLDAGSFSWASEAVSRQTRILDVVYNATSNELVRTKTLVKGAIVALDATPFIQWYYQHYGVHLRRQAVIRQVPFWLAEKQRSHWLQRHGYLTTWKGQRPATAKEKRVAAAHKKKDSPNQEARAKWKELAAKRKQRNAALRASIKDRLKKLAGRQGWGQKVHKPKGGKAAKKAPAKEQKSAKAKTQTKRRRLFKVVKGATANAKNWLAVPTKQLLQHKNARQKRRRIVHKKDKLTKKHIQLVSKKNPKSALRAVRRLIKFRRLKNRKGNVWNQRAKTRKLSTSLEEQLAAGKILARITSRPGQSGKADGYVLEDEELAFYLKKLEKKKGKGKK